jgi:DNA processing protein
MVGTPQSIRAGRTLTDDERLSWLRLSRSENVGPITFKQLLARFGTAEAALAALPGLARRGGRARPIRLPSIMAAEDEMAEIKAVGARLLALCEADYPAALAAIDDAPPLICVLGDESLLGRPAIAIVGARNASANGQRLARQLAEDLSQARFLIVSGLARGIDAAAHQGALARGTAAVLAGGLDVVYPEQNRGLYEEIAARGLLLSEMPPGTEPKSRHFPRRNRLVSGLSMGVLLVEATLRSGSLITARLALEQGREVFAVPGSPLDPRATGCNKLLRQGAVLVETAEDVTEALRDMVPAPLREKNAEAFRGSAPFEASTGEDGESADAPGESLRIDEVRDAVESLIGPEPVTVDELVRAGDLPLAAVLEAVLELELAGRVERHPGQRVAISGKSYPADALRRGPGTLFGDPE